MLLHRINSTHCKLSKNLTSVRPWCIVGRHHVTALCAPRGPVGNYYAHDLQTKHTFLRWFSHHGQLCVIIIQYTPFEVCRSRGRLQGKVTCMIDWPMLDIYDPSAAVTSIKQSLSKHANWPWHVVFWLKGTLGQEARGEIFTLGHVCWIKATVNEELRIYTAYFQQCASSTSRSRKCIY